MADAMFPPAAIIKHPAGHSAKIAGIFLPPGKFCLLVLPIPTLV